MKSVKYKEPSNYFPEDLMRELMEDGKKNIEKQKKKSSTNSTKKTGNAKKKK